MYTYLAIKSVRFLSPNYSLFFGRAREPFFSCEKKGSRPLLLNEKSSYLRE